MPADPQRFTHIASEAMSLPLRIPCITPARMADSVDADNARTPGTEPSIEPQGSDTEQLQELIAALV